ncbi:hypothetical protein [Cylindrospermopsis raciborskii]|nr:hypothetical protein [Cylindrospermopsis raciborskii]
MGTVNATGATSPAATFHLPEQKIFSAWIGNPPGFTSKDLP